MLSYYFILIEPLWVSRFSLPRPVPIFPESLLLVTLPTIVMGRSVRIEPLCVEASTSPEKFDGVASSMPPLYVISDILQTDGAACE